MKRLFICVGLATLVASPVVAQERVNPARAAAIRQCNAQAAQYKEYLWGNLEFEQYRACMSIHGQAE